MAQTAILITLALATVCFTVAYLLLKKEILRQSKNLFLPLGLSMGLAWQILYFSFPEFSDYITALYVWEIPFVILLSLLIFYQSKNRPLWQTALISLVSIEISCILLPSEAYGISPELPFWADRSILIALWLIYTLAFPLFTTIDGIAPLQGICVCAGIMSLSFIGAAPYQLGAFAVCGLAVFSAWLIYNTYPAKVGINPNSCYALGFLLGWLNIKTASEGAASSILSLNIFYFYEIAVCLLRGLSLKPQYKNWQLNTDFYQLSVSGLSPKDITNTISKLILLLIVFSIFSAYSPNQTSIPLFSLLICAWFFYRLNNSQEKVPTLKELPKTIIQDIKSNVSEISANFTKDKDK